MSVKSIFLATVISAIVFVNVVGFTYLSLPASNSFVYLGFQPVGNHLFASRYTFSELMSTLGTEHTTPTGEDQIVEFDENQNVVWQFDQNISYSHSIWLLPNGHILVADCGHNRIIEINYPQKDIVWEWNPTFVNWTKINPAWGSDHYYNNPIAYDWTHLNDVKLHNYTGYTAMLVSLRNWNLVIELNYTAEMLHQGSNESRVIWSYGNYTDTTLLNHQHSPSYASNGNILVADSDNHRVVEINYTTRLQERSYDELHWVRDIRELPDGTFLVTDSDRVIILNQEWDQVTWIYTQDISFPYQSQIVGNQLYISNSFDYTFIIFDLQTGKLVTIGTPTLRSLTIFDAVLLMFLFLGIGALYPQHRAIWIGMILGIVFVLFLQYTVTNAVLYGILMLFHWV